MVETAPVILNSDDESPQPSQFIGGLVLGIVLGTAGYYFFGTPEGKHLRSKLVMRWHKLAETVAAEQTGTKTDWSDKLRTGLKRVAAELGVGGSLTAKPSVLPKTRTTHSATALTPQRTKAKSARPRAKFRGV